MSGATSMRGAGRAFLLSRSAMLITIILVLGIVMTFFFPGTFFNAYNLRSILLNMAFDAMIVVGMTILLIGGEIDLSVGWNLGLSGVIYALLMTKVGLPFVPALLITLAVAVVNGFLVGLVVAKVGVNSFIATLAAGLIYYGLEFWISGGGAVTHLGKDVTAVGQANLAGLQLPAWYALAIVALFIYLMGRTKVFRRYFYIGLNKEVALHSGIPVVRMKIIAFVISSVLAAFAGVVSAARFGSAIIFVGQGMEMKAITAAMVGGVSFTGGIGSIPGALLGLLFIALINNGMIIANINAFWQPILIGCILLAAVVLDVRLKGMGGAIRQSRIGSVTEGGSEG